MLVCFECVNVCCLYVCTCLLFRRCVCCVYASVHEDVHHATVWKYELTHCQFINTHIRDYSKEASLAPVAPVFGNASYVPSDPLTSSSLLSTTSSQGYHAPYVPRDYSKEASLAPVGTVFGNASYAPSDPITSSSVPSATYNAHQSAYIPRDYSKEASLAPAVPVFGSASYVPSQPMTSSSTSQQPFDYSSPATWAPSMPYDASRTFTATSHVWSDTLGLHSVTCM
jgi:hypothetical protein